MHPFEYDSGTNPWTTKSATYPDDQVNNMACGVLNEAGTDYIYCVGGSAAVATPQRNACSGTIRLPMPSPVSLLPGPVTLTERLCPVASRSLTTSSISSVDSPSRSEGTNQIWEFTPRTNPWVQSCLCLSSAVTYPATTIGNLIYTASGSAQGWS